MHYTKDILWCDFETYSEVNIKRAGGYAYCDHESTNVLCLGFAINDDLVQIWTPNKTMPERVLKHVQDGGIVAAHNATFDARIWNNIMCSEFNWPKLLDHQLLDTMGLAASYALPLKLSDAGRAMNLVMQKDIIGTQLIKKLCKPNKQKEQPSPLDPLYAQDFKSLFAYCKRDVEAMRELILTLPRQYMIPQEREIWSMTRAMNSYGLPVAYEEASTIHEYLEAFIEKAVEQVPIITNGAFNTVNQIAKMTLWCKTQAYPMPNMQVDTVAEAVNDPACPNHVKKLLRLRQAVGCTSTAKYKKIIDQALPGKDNSYWIYDNLMYHGAAPGRWTGRGFQMHNLPRARVEDPEEVIHSFMENEVIEDPVNTAKALIRPMIKAPPGWKLIVSDYSSIENRVLHWLAMDTDTLADFEQGLDQYKIMAAARYKVPYDLVSKIQRQTGKIIILGAGYGMAWETYIRTAKLQFKLTVEEKDARDDISSYRTRYYKVPELWKGLKVAAAKTVISGQKHSYGPITFGSFTIHNIRWLAMQLPSGKCIYYKDPIMEHQLIPRYERMGPVPVITHEGFNSYAHKWMRMALTPGRLTENACQATAREIMAYGMLNVQNQIPEIKLIGTVHDEALGLIRDEHIHEDTMERFNITLCDIPFAKVCPLEAKGFIAERYRKE